MTASLSVAEYRALISSGSTLGGKKKARQARPRPAPASVDDIAGLPPGRRVVLHFPPIACNPNWHGAEWIKRKARKRYRSDCAVLALAGGLGPMLPCIRAATGKVHFRIDFFPPPGARLDDDNVIASFKAGQDGIADAIRIDDKRFAVEHVFHSEPRSCVVVTLLKNIEINK